MLRTVVEARTLVAMMVAAGVGTWGLRAHPVDQENLFLALIAAKDPTVFHVLTYGYATMWFSTPFFAASLALSTLTIVAYRHAPSVRSRALPEYPLPERRPSPSVVLGEAHFLNTPGRAHYPSSLSSYSHCSPDGSESVRSKSIGSMKRADVGDVACRLAGKARV